MSQGRVWLCLMGSIVLIGSLISLVSCQRSEAKGVDTHESLSAELAAKMDEFGAAFSSVTDLASGERAVERIGVLGDEFVALARRFEPLGAPSEEQKRLISGHLLPAQQRMNEAWMEFLNSGVDGDVLVIVGEAFTGIGDRVSEAQRIIHQ